MKYSPFAILGGAVVIIGLAIFLVMAIASRGTAEQNAPATLTVPEDAVIQESEVTLSLTGFRPRESVVLSVLDQDQPNARQIGEFKADDAGNINELAIGLPDWLTSGTHQIEAYGKSSRRRADGTLSVRAKDIWINLDKYAFKQGEKLGFIAGGFEPSAVAQVFLVPKEVDSPAKPGATPAPTTVVTQTSTTSSPVATFQTDAAGNTAWSEFQVPLISPGGYDLTLMGNDQSRSVSRTITIEGLKPSFELSPWSSPPGATFDVNVQGFLAGEEVQLFFGKDAEPAAILKADVYGNIWGGGPILVPYGMKAGPNPVILSGTTSKTKTVQNFSVIGPKPWGELTVYSGYPGTAVQFGGGGFNAGEKVFIYIGGSDGPLVATAVTDSQGNLMLGSYYIVQAAGDEFVNFYFLGEKSQAWTTAKFKIIEFPVPKR